MRVGGWARFADIHELSYLFPAFLSLSFHLNALPNIFYSLPDIFYSKDLPNIKRLLFKLVVFTTLVCVHYFVLSWEQGIRLLQRGCPNGY